MLQHCNVSCTISMRIKQSYCIFCFVCSANNCILALIVMIALTEFFIKIATGELSELHGISLNSVALGFTLLPMLLKKSVISGFGREIKNIPWAFLCESFTFAATACLYFAMAGLPATFVASVGATQPLIVLFLERITEGFTGKLTKDHALLPKLSAISLIVMGVILLFLSGAI